MVHFEDKTGNHAKGFRIQKHLLPANESCVLALQNCCATDFRKTVIRFVARQVPRRIPPRKFGVPGRLAPFQSLSRRPPYGACRRAASTAKHRGARAKTAKACDRPAHTTNILHTACPPTRADYPRNALPTSRNMCFLDTISPNGKGAFQRPKSWREL